MSGTNVIAFPDNLLSFASEDPRFNVVCRVLVALATVLLIRASVQFMTRQRKMVEIAEKLPGRPLKGSHPWLAQGRDFMATIGTIPNRPKIPRSIELFSAMRKETADDGLFRVWIFNPYRIPFARCMVLLVDPYLCQQFFTDKEITTKIVKNKRMSKISERIVGDSFLMLPDGPEWKHQRKMTARGFHQNFLEFTNRSAVKLLQTKVFPRWDAGINDSTNKSGGGTFTVEMVEWASCMTLEVLGEVAFSYSFGGLDEKAGVDKVDGEDSRYEMYLFMLTMIIRRIRAPPFVSMIWFKDNIRFRKCCRILDATIEAIVRKRYEELEAAKQSSSGQAAKADEKFTDLLSYLMSEDEDGNRMPYRTVFGNTRMFLFAGHDTTAGILAAALWELATHPRVQKLLQKEIDELFDTLEDGTTTPAYKDLIQLKYLDAVVKEALRLHASAAVGRSVESDVTLRNKDGKAYTLPAGAMVYMVPMVSHRCDKYFENALDFVPERYMGEGASESAKNSFTFGFGPRNCVGQPLAVAELKIILAHVMRRYTVKRNAKANEPIPCIVATVKPHEVLLDVERRQFEC